MVLLPLPQSESCIHSNRQHQHETPNIPYHALLHMLTGVDIQLYDEVLDA